MAGESQRAQRAVTKEMERRLHAIAEHGLGESQRIALLDEGTLAASGHLEPASGVGHDAEGAYVLIVYSTPYARRRHEEVNVTPSQPGRQPKWLERTVKANLGRWRRVLEAPMPGSM